jgi:hypothetical protein
MAKTPKISKQGQAMLDALSYLLSLPDTFRPGINLRGAGQYATARALARRGLVQYFPGTGRIEPSRDMYALASVLGK